ncbi:RNA ligase partner protein [Candidatus Micrarchaeota archaeon]|nr:RNA ligase partner protein [Candidatus Micrarchaeota archaeon]
MPVSSSSVSDRIFVVDTSLFVNPYARSHFGKTPSSAVVGFIKQAKALGLKVYMPPAIFRELRNFVDEKSHSNLQTFVRIRSPSIYDIRLPAAVFYDFIEDVRERINKGLRLAEDFAKDNHPDNDEKLRKLREKYREFMRTGILDSKEDLELVLVAKELDATLISSDEGALNFARQLGCGTLPAEKFFALLKSMKK